MQVSSAPAIGEYDSQAIRKRTSAEAPLSPGLCLVIWAVMSGLGWGLVGAVAAFVG